MAQNDKVVQNDIVVKITQELLDSLTAQAKASPRLRMNLDLRNSPSDGSQRMLNALEPGTVMPIHRHRASSETVVIIRGKIQWVFYDEDGNETERVNLDANGDLRMLIVERGPWHSLVCLEEGSVLFEVKNGAYALLGEVGAALCNNGLHGGEPSKAIKVYNGVEEELKLDVQHQK